MSLKPIYQQLNIDNKLTKKELEQKNLIVLKIIIERKRTVILC
jgi:hypothetical protein